MIRYEGHTFTKQNTRNAFGLDWWNAPKEEKVWKSIAGEFVTKLRTAWGLSHKTESARAETSQHCNASVRLPQWEPEDFTWQRPGRSFEIRVDNRLVASWVVGSANCHSDLFRKRVDTAINTLYGCLVVNGWALRHECSDWARWVPRERNVIADELANLALDYGQNLALEGSTMGR